MNFTLQRIQAFRLTSVDIERLARFYVEALGFEAAPKEPIPPEELALLGIRGQGHRIPLKIGDGRLDLDGFDEPGRAFPGDSNAADLVFQHFALATSDATQAWACARARGAVPISRHGAVRLPQSAGGVTAVKFRDPEGHPLELLQFPLPAAGRWCGNGVLGIDHSALSVEDLESTRRFFLDHGLCVTSQSLNTGEEQSALDGLEPVAVDVLSLSPPSEGPHLELLAYRAPRGRAGPALAPNDVAATRTVWQSDVDALIRDPAGHFHLLERGPD